MLRNIFPKIKILAKAVFRSNPSITCCNLFDLYFVRWTVDEGTGFPILLFQTAPGFQFLISRWFEIWFNVYLMNILYYMKPDTYNCFSYKLYVDDYCPWWNSQQFYIDIHWFTLTSNVDLKLTSTFDEENTFHCQRIIPYVWFLNHFGFAIFSSILNKSRLSLKV